MTNSLQTITNRLCYYFLYLCIGLYSPAALIQEDVVAGRVVATRGQVSAVDATGSSRPLNRRAEVRVGDTITTGADAFAQIRMSDDAIIALKESTGFQILAYS